MLYFPNAIPVTLLTGFLGSGKTTLLRTLLGDPMLANAAVIINEFGEVGLDHSLIEHSDDKLIELQSGCICCTIQKDLHRTLWSLYEKGRIGAHFDRVIIETTGLADPIPIIHTLMTAPDLLALYQLDHVITLVDAVNGEHTLDVHPEAAKQAAMADTLVISKIDLIDRRVVHDLVARLRLLNPAATVLLGQPGDQEIPSLLTGGGYDPYKQSEDAGSWLRAELYASQSQEHRHSQGANRHGDDIHAFALTHEEPIRRFAFELFLDMLVTSMGSRLLRIKGILHIRNEDRPAVIHGVQQICHPVRWLDRWPDEDRRSRLVFITKGIPREEIEPFFKTLIAAVEDVLEEMDVDPEEYRRPRPPAGAAPFDRKPQTPVR